MYHHYLNYELINYLLNTEILNNTNDINIFFYFYDKYGIDNIILYRNFLFNFLNNFVYLNVNYN